MEDALQAFLRRFEPFEDRFDLQPTSYQIRNEDGSPGAWIAQVQVWERRADESLVTPMFPTGNKRHASKAVADAIALWEGLRWLEEGRPALKIVGQ